MYSENKTLTPTCIIYVDGERLDWKYEGALESVKVSDRLNEAGTASLLFGMPAGEFDGGGAFSEGSEVSVCLGYKDDMQEAFAGEVTGISPRFGERAAPQTEVRLETRLRRLKKERRARSFENKTPAQTIYECKINNQNCVKVYFDSNSKNKFNMLSEKLIYKLTIRKDHKTIIKYDKNSKANAAQRSSGDNHVNSEQNFSLFILNANVNYAPDKNKPLLNGLGEGKNWEHDRCFSLVHELIHAYHVVYNNYNEKYGETEKEETKTCIETNKIIEEMRALNLTNTQNRTAYNFYEGPALLEDLNAKYMLDDEIKQELLDWGKY